MPCESKQNFCLPHQEQNQYLPIFLPLFQQFDQMGWFVPYKDALYLSKLSFQEQQKGRKITSFLFEQCRLSQLLIKWLLVFQSLQSDLPQLTDPQVPSAKSKPSQLRGWIPITVIMFSVVLLNKFWMYGIVYKGSCSLFKAFPACCHALRKLV